MELEDLFEALGSGESHEAEPRPSPSLHRNLQPKRSVPTTPDESPSTGDVPHPDTVGVTTDFLREAWAAAIGETPDLGGAAIALRGVRVEKLDDGQLTLHVPSGLKADLKALFEDEQRSAPLRDNLAQRLSLDVIELEIIEESRRQMTAKDASEQRVNSWMERDPSLKEAVEELDLTFKE